MKLKNKMKPKLIVLGLLVGALLLPVSGLSAQKEVSFELPLLTTSAGQSPEIDTLNLLVDRTGINYDYCDAPPVKLVKKGVGLGGKEPDKNTSYNYISIGTDTSKYPEGTPYKTIIFSIGASLKGMGASGLSVKSEKNRLEGILDYAEGSENEESGIDVIGVHIGGSARRGAPGSANEIMINTVAPRCDYLIVSSGGNNDGKFTEIAEENDITLKEIDSPLGMVPVVKDLFSESDE